MLSSWNLQANSKKYRTGNRSDAIIIPSPVINYVRPDLYVGKGAFAGPADIWNPKKGFLVQSIDFESIHPESYSLNFPTTGGHNLYFDLLITGIDVRDLTWEPVTHEGITATVTNVVANDVWIPSGNVGQVVARVKLTGPEARSQWKNPSPSQIAKPRLPQTFELVGRDRDGVEVVKYGFVLRQWFVNRGGQLETYSDHLAWCNSLGYRMPRVRDLTNAVRKVNPSISGAAPSSSDNNYMRHIGAGFFAEWGETLYYTGAGFDSSSHWTSDATGSDQFYIRASNGDIYSVYPNFWLSVLCTAP